MVVIEYLALRIRFPIHLLYEDTLSEDAFHYILSGIFLTSVYFISSGRYSYSSSHWYKIGFTGFAPRGRQTLETNGYELHYRNRATQLKKWQLSDLHMGLG